MRRLVTITAASVAILVALVVISLAVAFPGPTPGQLAAREAGDRLTQEISALDDGVTVDLANAIDQPWDRVVLMEAYMSGDEMNRQLGFDWYSADDVSASDESQRAMAVVQGTTVIVEVGLGPETFRIDSSITSFQRATSVFVTERDKTGIVELRRP